MKIISIVFLVIITISSCKVTNPNPSCKETGNPTGRVSQKK